MKVGKLNLVDLAGSENIGRSGATGKNAREAGKINRSLLTLGKVITALTENHCHIPYRESKLTHLLQESLGGKAKTCIIATISPASDCLDETLSTLDYAYRARNIKNRPQANEQVSKKVMIQEYQSQIEALNVKLSMQRQKDGVHMSLEEYEKQQNELKENQGQLKVLEQKVAEREKSVEELRESIMQKSLECEERTSELSETRMELEETKEELDITKNELRMEQEKVEEKDHLLSEQQKCERKLAEEAGEQAERLERATKHIEGAEAKVERQKSVLAKNGAQFGQLREEMEQKLQKMGSMLQQHQAEQEATRKHVKDVVSQHIVATKRDYDAALNSLQGLLKKVSESKEKMMIMESQHLDSLGQKISLQNEQLGGYQRDAQGLYLALEKECSAALCTLELHIVDQVKAFTEFATRQEARGKVDLGKMEKECEYHANTYDSIKLQLRGKTRRIIFDISIHPLCEASTLAI